MRFAKGIDFKHCPKMEWRFLLPGTLEAPQGPYQVRLDRVRKTICHSRAEVTCGQVECSTMAVADKIRHFL